MRRLSNLLLYGGVAICALGVAGLIGGMWVSLPPAAVRRIAMALPFAVGGALLIVGAIVGRAARRVEASTGKALPSTDRAVPHIGAGAPGRSERSDAPVDAARR